MARKKLIVQRIANDAARRAAFRKRRMGLVKKASELSTLCGVDACVVVYGEGEVHPTVVWPSPTQATAVLERFKAMPDLDRCKKTSNLEGFLRKKVDMLQEQVEKLRLEDQERETKMHLLDVMTDRRGLDGLTMKQTANLSYTIDALMESASNRLKELGVPIPPLGDMGVEFMQGGT